MESKCLEIRDRNTFMPVIAIRPTAANPAQRYLLRRDGYRADTAERCIILIAPQCRGVAYDPYDWQTGARTIPQAHRYIEAHWHELADGDVVDVEFILSETSAPKRSEAVDYP